MQVTLSPLSKPSRVPCCDNPSLILLLFISFLPNRIYELHKFERIIARAYCIKLLELYASSMTRFIFPLSTIISLITNKCSCKITSKQDVRKPRQWFQQIQKKKKAYTNAYIKFLWINKGMIQQEGRRLYCLLLIHMYNGVTTTNYWAPFSPKIEYRNEQSQWNGMIFFSIRH